MEPNDQIRQDTARQQKEQQYTEQEGKVQQYTEQEGKVQQYTEQEGNVGGKGEEKDDSLIMSNLALDTIQMSKVKTIQNLGAVDMAMQSLVRMKRLFLGLLIFSIVALILNISIVAMTTYFAYKDVIDTVNNNMNQTQGAPGGFATAVAIRFPVLAKLMGFTDSSYPLAIFFCLRDGSFNAIFSQNPGQYMSTMWTEAMQGGSCGIIGNIGIPSPIEMICCAFQSTNVALQACDAPCNAYSSTSTPSVIGNTINAGVSGGQLGMDVGGPPGAAIGAVLSMAISLGITYGSKMGQTTPPCIQ